MPATRPHFVPFASYPAIRLVLLLIGGIILDYHLEPPQILWLLIFSFSILVYILLEFRHYRTLHMHLYNYLMIAYLLSVVALGGTWHSLHDNRRMPSQAHIINSYTWEELNFSGRVYQRSSTSSGSLNLDIAIDTTFFPVTVPRDGDAQGQPQAIRTQNTSGLYQTIPYLTWPAEYNLRVLADTPLLEETAPFVPGQRLTFSAIIYPLEGPRNPHDFDYRQYLASKDIYARGKILSLSVVEDQTSVLFSWISLRQNVLQIIDRNFSLASAPLANALLVGHKYELTPDLKRSFSRAGLSHIMAVSGLHVGFLLIPCWFLTPFFWTRRYGKEIGLTLLILLLFLYAGITGFTASVTRAALAGGFLMYARLFHKVRDAKNLMAVAALIILLANPSDLFSIGFQLSFTAVYMILLVMPVLSGYLPEGLQERWYGKIIMVIIISILVQSGLFPLLTYYFSEYSLIGPLANALAVPLLVIILPWALALIPVGFLFPDLAILLTLPADLYLTYLSTIVEWASRTPGSWISVHTDSLLLFGLWAVATFFLAALPYPRRRWKLLILLLGLIILEQGRILLHRLQPPVLQVTIFDVGQGDASIIRTPSGRNFLIDAGRWQQGYNSATSIIIPHLAAEGITRLDGILLTHPHADHIGGMKALLQAIPIDTIYHTGSDYNSQLYKEFMVLTRQNKVPLKTLRAGNMISLDPALRAFIYSPGSSAAFASNINNRSLILEIIYGSTEFLFMGDAEERQEREVMAAYGPLIDTDFLKVGHHGSNSSSTSPFLLQSTPSVAVISVGKANRFQHPHPRPMRRLRRLETQLHFTSLQGALIFESDGTAITTNEWK